MTDAELDALTKRMSTVGTPAYREHMADGKYFDLWKDCRDAADAITQLRARLAVPGDAGYDEQAWLSLREKLGGVPDDSPEWLARWLAYHGAAAWGNRAFPRNLTRAAAMLRSQSTRIAELDAENGRFGASAHALGTAMDECASQAAELTRLRARIADAYDLLEDQMDYCSESGPNFAMRIACILRPPI